jgi:hypothetical protein
MAKSIASPNFNAGAEPIPTIDRKVEEFAEDLGRVLGEARNKADGWLSQRESIVRHLEGVRDTATHLLQQLGVGAAPAASTAPGAPTAPVKRGPRRPSTVEAASPKRRTMSAEARAKIAAAQRARWAKQKAKTAQSASADQPSVKRGPGRPRKAKAPRVPRKRRTISAEGRERIAAAQRARWAKQKAGKE